MPGLPHVLLTSALLLSARSVLAVEPIPEAEQAQKALAIIDAYHAPRPAKPPKLLNLVYFTPSDRDPADRYAERLDAILEDIRSFYRDGMEKLGFGPRTFGLPRGPDGKLIIHMVKSQHSEADFVGWKGRNNGNTGAPEAGDLVRSECLPILKKSGLNLDEQTSLIFCHLATYDPEAHTFRHHSPYFGRWQGQGGLCFVADWSNQNVTNLFQKGPRVNDGEYGNMSLGKHTTIFIGGIAHELGHAFGLPHCGERWDEKARGTSLMGAGNHTYREELRGEGKGTILTMASAMRLASRPLFNGSDKGETLSPVLERCSLNLTTNISRADLAGRRGAMRVEGSVAGTPPIYGVIAYFDCYHDEYRAPCATSVPDAEGRFAIEISDLAPCANGALRVEFCHVNGAVSAQTLGFGVNSDGRVDLTQWEMRQALEAIGQTVANRDKKATSEELSKLNATNAPKQTKAIAQALAQTLEGAPTNTPAEMPRTMQECPLGDTKANSREVGWLVPAYNRLPPNNDINSPFLDSGKIYRTGLFAHSPSRYEFDLGGAWKRLRGEAGIHSLEQPYAAGVVFVIKADGRELYRSPAIRKDNHAAYDVDLTGAKTLELLVEKAGVFNNNNWALWLEPTLSR